MKRSGPRGRTRLVAALVAALTAGALAGPPAKPAPEVVAVPDPHARPRYHCWEPHVAAHPKDPRQLLLSAMHTGVAGRGEGARKDSRLCVWRSGDGGRTWSEPATPFDGPGARPTRADGDLVVAFGPDRACWLAGCGFDSPPGGRPGDHWIKACRSADGGRTWEPPVTVAEYAGARGGKGIVDKPWVAVDAGDGPRKGTAYVAWTEFDGVAKPGRVELRCAARPPGADRFKPAVRVGEPVDLKEPGNLVHHVQLVVRGDGTLDAVWRQPPAGRVLHARSSDGGATFSAPAAVAGDEKTGAAEFPTLAATPGGLVAAWTSGDRVQASVLLDTGTWTPARPVGGEMPAGVRLSHPAAASAAGAVWVLAYRWEKEPAKVSVVLYRSADRGGKWQEHCVIASRVPAGDARALIPGDYVSLAAANDTLHAAYVLPVEGGRKPRLYVARVDVRRP